eukprot:Protomagalhaensia_sp_Gyna_25__4804@NODE_489_length_3285_cov_6_870302_g380_i0_p2_GENE_NODE_489_length_3285_cov_6_870302_g380_i0NODE_489_length_3285_cov_6_870302_g380_i0_p2_ORF_typecomplete_len435_score51_21AAA_22/PF13401_6/3_9e12AAA_22/PF13401_6/2_2e02AAA_lid_10/PF17872_1/1_4e08TniB/PF05621_11/8_7e08AAA_16/PF13191_6/3_6e06AAA_16/PF13191_6/1_9e02AAA/PF00004_29/9_5e07ATPase_2/PF01637_18/1_4e06NACHT/PF05729_12/6e05Rad17/PF03215_15/9e05AAA_PrkA/PF08298_11/7_2e05DUF2075/PF09848_9/0_00013AAA_30/PF13604
MPPRSKKGNATKPNKITKEDIPNLLALLQIDHHPESLKGREEQINRLTHELSSSMSSSLPQGHILYLYGQPGTGKSATVSYVITRLKETQERSFGFSHINALGLSSVGGLFQQLYHSLYPNGKKRMTIPNAFKALDDGFRIKGFRKHHIVVIDEFDNLLAIGRSSKAKDSTAFHQRVFSLFDWPCQPKANVTLVCIANTLCLPHHLLPRCFSRLGLGQINFPAYKYDQLEDILYDRLHEYNKDATKLFEPQSLQLLCRKVAAYSGDVRKLFDLCSALLRELAEAPNSKPQVLLGDIERRCRVQFASRIAEYIRRSAFPIQLAALCICALQPTQADATTGFAVGYLEVRLSFQSQQELLTDGQCAFAPALLDRIVSQALDELQSAGILDFVQFMRIEHESRVSKGIQRTALESFKPWGQLGVCLIPPVSSCLDIS